MVEHKFKLGNICRVVRKNTSCSDSGSCNIENFKIKKITKGQHGTIYWPTGGGQGAYEMQLELAKVTNWRNKIQNEQL